MVLVTGWGGFYLGSMQSGISSLQRGLLDTLLRHRPGLRRSGRAQRGPGAQNRRAHDPHRQPAAGRGALLAGAGHRGRPGRLALGAIWLLLHTNLLTVALALLTAFTTWPFTRRSSASPPWPPSSAHFPAPWARCSAGPPPAPHRVAGVALFAILFVWQFPHFMAISWLYRDDYARAGIRMLPVVQPDGWSTVAEALFFAVVMIPVSLTPWWLGMAGITYAVLATALGLLYLAYTIRFAGILRAKDETESRMLARDLLKVSVLYLPLLFTTLMLCATARH
jgi:heme o synthase